MGRWCMWGRSGGGAGGGKWGQAGSGVLPYLQSLPGLGNVAEALPRVKALHVCTACRTILSDQMAALQIHGCSCHPAGHTLQKH